MINLTDIERQVLRECEFHPDGLIIAKSEHSDEISVHVDNPRHYQAALYLESTGYLVGEDIDEGKARKFHLTLIGGK